MRGVDAVGYISIHAPRMGSDAVPNLDVATLALFQSTLPGWGATIRIQGGCGNRFQSTLPGWGATQLIRARDLGLLISIHAPRMGSDFARRIHRLAHSHFNPRSPDGERLSRRYDFFHIWKISIHAPRMGSDPGIHCAPPHLQAISIHAPRMGSDGLPIRHIGPVRISIHAPRMGSDNTGYLSFAGFLDFNPRSPDGERHVHARTISCVWHISIHAPRMGSDVRPVPRRDRADRISIHAPRMGSDLAPALHADLLPISIHAPRMGSD
ncbi:Uncharacterised protein [Bifidobacterium bifidum]|nr:Uncharacterised protein [Bifidobacterium bifidum]